MPNVVFLLFLFFRFKSTKQKLRQTTSPIFATFYLLVCINVTTSLLRCIISMLVNVTSPAGDITDKVCPNSWFYNFLTNLLVKPLPQVFWVIVRFFLLSTEISVLVFGLAFGHLDSQTSIRRVLLVTSFIALAYSICQGCLEIVVPDEAFYIVEKDYYLFSHGGMIFWFCTCLIFALMYLLVFLLPWTPCRSQIPLPGNVQHILSYNLQTILRFMNFIEFINI